MARLSAVCTALRDALREVTGLSTVHYPAPGSISGNQITAVVYGGLGELRYQGGSSQEWLETIRVQIYVGAQDTPTALGALDALLEPIADRFTPANVSYHTLGGLVDFCMLATYEFAQILEFAQQSYYGGTLNFSVKRHRFAGDE